MRQLSRRSRRRTLRQAEFSALRTTVSGRRLNRFVSGRSLLATGPFFVPRGHEPAGGLAPSAADLSVSSRAQRGHISEWA